MAELLFEQWHEPEVAVSNHVTTHCGRAHRAGGVRTKAAGLLPLTSLKQKVTAWARVTEVMAAPMSACLVDLAGKQPSEIVDRVLITKSSECCADQREETACSAG